ncbi:MAG: hypothetical protein AAF363_21320 [Bacteroidota bacterium]
MKSYLRNGRHITNLVPRKESDIQIQSQKSENQDFNSLNSSWKDLLEHALAFDGKEFFGDASKLRLFAVNCLESYQEYGMVKDCSQEELRSVLYYFGKKYESEKSPPVGNEMRFLHLIYSKTLK